MSSFECTAVLNPSLVSAPDEALFWPASRQRLVLLFEIQIDNKIVVRGIDPDLADRSVLVFRADLTSDQKDRFVQAVSSGREPTQIPAAPVSNENRDPGVPATPARTAGSLLAGKPFAGEIHSDAIVITDPPGGPGEGPKLYILELPSAARATGTQG